MYFRNIEYSSEKNFAEEKLLINAEKKKTIDNIGRVYSNYKSKCIASNQKGMRKIYFIYLSIFIFFFVSISKFLMCILLVFMHIQPLLNL